MSAHRGLMTARIGLSSLPSITLMKEREKSRGRKLCVYMANHIDDALDELVSQLLGCSAWAAALCLAR